MTHEYTEYEPLNITAYEFLKSKTKEYLHLTAIDFYGHEITYKELFENIDKAEKALRAYGIQENDTVALSLPGMPEAVYLIYAINKIGALYCAFDCRSRKDEIIDTFNAFKPKLCIIPDFQLREFKDFTFCPIVYVAPIHSIEGKAHLSSSLCDLFTGRSFMTAKNKNLIKFKAFMEKGKDGINLSAKKSNSDIFGYFYTSGTTYGRKCIILTNENINASTIQSSIRESNAAPEDILLNIMPLFTCYGFTVATHLPLSRGLKIKIIPLIKPKRLRKTIFKEKPNFLITVPAHWEYFIKGNFKNRDLSFIKTIIVGGDSVDPNFEEKLNSILKSCNSRAWLRSAYGLSETTSAGTSPIPNTPKGSVGVPLIHTKVGIFDIQDSQPLPANTLGEICICGPSVCKGYYNEKELTEKLLQTHSDGKVWLHSGDMGYIDDNGFLFFCERIKRMYVRYDGTKVSPYSIEQQLIKCPEVEHCMVVSVNDDKHSHGKCAKAIIVLKKGISSRKGKRLICKFIDDNVDQHMRPKELQFVDRLSYTKNGKLDYFSAAK